MQMRRPTGHFKQPFSPTLPPRITNVSATQHMNLCGSTPIFSQTGMTKNVTGDTLFWLPHSLVTQYLKTGDSAYLSLISLSVMKNATPKLSTDINSSTAENVYTDRMKYLLLCLNHDINSKYSTKHRQNVVKSVKSRVVPPPSNMLKQDSWHIC